MLYAYYVHVLSRMNNFVLTGIVFSYNNVKVVQIIPYFKWILSICG